MCYTGQQFERSLSKLSENQKIVEIGFKTDEKSPRTID